VEIDNGLLEKYRALLAENHSLREENEILKARLGITDPSRPNPPRDPEIHLPLAYEAPDLPEKKPPRGAPSQLDPAASGFVQIHAPARADSRGVGHAGDHLSLSLAGRDKLRGDEGPECL